MTILPLLLALHGAAARPATAKYVYLFIGDGMGLAQVALAEAYEASIRGDSLGFVPTVFSNFPVLGMSTTQCATRRITESSAAATAFATGTKGEDGSLGLDPHDHTPLRTIAEDALGLGRGVGILTTTSIDHATPAGFYAHVPDRNQYYEIGVALAKSRMDVFAGGSFRDPDGKKSKAPGRSVWELAREAGYDVVRGRKALQTRTSRHLIAFSAPAARDSAVPYELDRDTGDDDQPSLEDFVSETSRLLDGPKGFFVMAEGGKIDWACHRNDARASIGEVMGLDTAVRAALTFARKHPGEVLIVVTADHETGGLSLGNAALGYQSNLGLLRHQVLSQERLEDSLAPLIHPGNLGWLECLKPLGTWTGLGMIEELSLDRSDSAALREAFEATRTRASGPWGTYQPLAWTATRLVSQKSGIGWTSPVHTAIPVPVYAWGVGSEAFSGRMDNTDLARRLRKAMGVR